MTRLDFGQLLLLTTESVRDAMRRRLVWVVLAICFVSILIMRGCTSFDGSFQMQGATIDPMQVLGWGGVVLFLVIGLWIIALAGLLAADHLAHCLEEGGSHLVLARSVSRETFVLARLAGSLVVSLGAGLVLLGAAGFFLSVRNDLPMLPAVLATLACFWSAIGVAAMAMTASLFLTRIATALLTLVAVAFVSSLNLITLWGFQLSGLYGLYEVLNDYGPPLATAIGAALAPWASAQVPAFTGLGIVVRMVLWTAGPLATLFFAFRQREL